MNIYYYIYKTWYFYIIKSKILNYNIFFEKKIFYNKVKKKSNKIK